MEPDDKPARKAKAKKPPRLRVQEDPVQKIVSESAFGAQPESPGPTFKHIRTHLHDLKVESKKPTSVGIDTAEGVKRILCDIIRDDENPAQAKIAAIKELNDLCGWRRPKDAVDIRRLDQDTLLRTISDMLVLFRDFLTVEFISSIGLQGLSVEDVSVEASKDQV
jgi:hypothetical protein